MSFEEILFVAGLGLLAAVVAERLVGQLRIGHRQWQDRRARRP